MDIFEVSELIGSIKAGMEQGLSYCDQEMLDFYINKREELKQELYVELARTLKG